MSPGLCTLQAAETLGLPIERVKFTLGDTRLPRAPVHGGSLTTASVGSAVQAACHTAREDALARGGGGDVTEAMRRIGQPVEASADAKPGDEAKRFSMHAFGAVFVEVAVDPDLGETRVRRIVGAYGAGRIVNPKMVRSQCIGGMIGGIGMALMEHSVVDSRNGRVSNANLAEYAVPVHADSPPVMDVISVDEQWSHADDPRDPYRHSGISRRQERRVSGKGQRRAILRMTTWTGDGLGKIEAAEEVALASVRRDGTLRDSVTIWVGRVGDDLYVRSWKGPRRRLVPRDSGAPRRPHPGRRRRQGRHLRA
jgi:hypothetical protein